MCILSTPTIWLFENCLYCYLKHSFMLQHICSSYPINNLLSYKLHECLLYLLMAYLCIKLKGGWSQFENLTQQTCGYWNGFRALDINHSRKAVKLWHRSFPTILWSNSQGNLENFLSFHYIRKLSVKQNIVRRDFGLVTVFAFSSGPSFPSSFASKWPPYDFTMLSEWTRNDMLLKYLKSQKLWKKTTLNSFMVVSFYYAWM